MKNFVRALLFAAALHCSAAFACQNCAAVLDNDGTLPANRIAGAGPAPGIAVGPAAGGGTAAISNGSSITGTIVVNTGLTAATVAPGVLFTLTYSTNQASPVIIPAGTMALGTSLLCSGTPTGATCSVTGVLTASQTYRFTYLIVGN